MKKYILLHKDIMVSAFAIEDNEVRGWFIPKSRAWEHLPLPLKVVVHKHIYIEQKNSYSVTDEDNLYRLQEWLEERSIPSKRNNIQAYLDGTNLLKYMLDNNALSLTDCYWVKEVGDTRTWDEMKLYNSNKIQRLQIIENTRDEGGKYSGINSTLGGNLEKFWYYSYSTDGKQLVLAKRTDRLNSILSIREVVASKIYKAIGFDNYCTYKYIKNHNGEIVGCKCKAFTDEQHELITATDILMEHNELFSNYDKYNLILERAAQYGLDIYKAKKQLDTQTLVDYLIQNRDRHLNNMGFIRNPDTLQIYGMAPIFDSGSSQVMERKNPFGVSGTTINGPYDTDDEILKTLTLVSRQFLMDRLPSSHLLLKEIQKDKDRSYMYFVNMYKSRLKYIKSIIV